MRTRRFKRHFSAMFRSMMEPRGIVVVHSARCRHTARKGDFLGVLEWHGIALSWTYEDKGLELHVRSRSGKMR